MLTEKIVNRRFGITLRPVEVRDAEFIIKLRRSPRARDFLNYTSPNVQKQEQWILAQRSRANDVYFIIEDASIGPSGIIGIYDLHDNIAEWGRWAMVPESRATLGAVLMTLQYGFDTLKATELSAYTMASNDRALAFQNKLCEPFATLERKVYRENASITIPFLQHRITSSDWPAILTKWHDKAVKHPGFRWQNEPEKKAISSASI